MCGLWTTKYSCLVANCGRLCIHLGGLAMAQGMFVHLSFDLKARVYTALCEAIRQNPDLDQDSFIAQLLDEALRAREAASPSPQ